MIPADKQYALCTIYIVYVLLYIWLWAMLYIQWNPSIRTPLKQGHLHKTRHFFSFKRLICVLNKMRTLYYVFRTLLICTRGVQFRGVTSFYTHVHAWFCICSRSSYMSGESLMQCAMVALVWPMQLCQPSVANVVARSNLELFRSHPQHTPWEQNSIALYDICTDLNKIFQPDCQIFSLPLECTTCRSQADGLAHTNRTCNQTSLSAAHRDDD